MEPRSIPKARRKTGRVAGRRGPPRAKTKAMAKEKATGGKTKAGSAGEAQSEIEIELEIFGRQATPIRSIESRSRSRNGCPTRKGVVAEQPEWGAHFGRTSVSGFR